MKNLKTLFILLTLTALSSMAHAEDSSKELWLKFNGTNYCKPGFCAEVIPNQALAPALEFYKSNQGVLVNNTRYIGIIDFSIQSTLKRFFILNLKTGAVESLLVTHGKKSETSPGWAGTFSNIVGSEMSSLGFFVTDIAPYYGKHGISLKLDGVSSTNKNARERLIVIHGADYATQWFADKKGRLGLSQGCPAVSPDKIEGVIKKLKGEALLYIYSSSSDI
jgi:hypothetical protein